MNTVLGFRWMSLFLVLVAGTLFAAAAPAHAQNHDLVMNSMETNPPSPEAGCFNQVKAHFFIDGLNDYLVPSGGAFVDFTYPNGSSHLTVTYAPSDGLFAIGNEWPDQFASVSDGFTDYNSITLFIPAGATQWPVTAHVDYAPGTVDEVPGNNTLQQAFDVVTPASCSYQPPSHDICKINPAICHMAECDTPGCIRLKFDPDNCPACGFGPIVITVSLPVEMQLVAYAGGEREVARSSPMARVEKTGGKTYNQQLVLNYQKGTSYTFKIMSPRGAVGKAAIRTDIQMRQLTSSRVILRGGMKAPDLRIQTR